MLQRPDITTPLGLAHLLRNRELWPSNFKWNYNNVDDCGMGLLFRVLGRELPKNTDDCVNTTADILGLGNWTAWSIFAMLAVEPVRLEQFMSTGMPVGGTCKRRTVTPEMVATALEECQC